ncbi:hypothetical protein TRVA0_079S00100 [Trichomonascus vanleenenianus]|uniref:F-box protein n=1 Tax=Trichomonascus vanleenenianus TaxID=2268995 RepID=UPI003EC97930
MLKLPGEIWLIVLQYLREHDYDIDGHLWRVRLVCRTLSDLADSLIWRKVSLLVYDMRYKSGTRMSYEFESLLDVVIQVDSFNEAWISCTLDSLFHFLEIIRSYAYYTQLEDRHSVIQHIDAAEEIINWGITDGTPCNTLVQALLAYKQDRAAGIKAITEALSAPYCGYTTPKYYSTQIDLYNIDRMFDIVRRYYPYIKHVKLVVGEVTGCDSAIRHFAKLFEGLLQNSRLETVNVTLKDGDITNERKIKEQQMVFLQKVAENPPQRVLIDVEYRFTPDIVKILNTLPNDGTQLIIRSEVIFTGPVSKLKANVISMKIGDSFDVAPLQQFLSVYKSLTYLDMYLGTSMGHLRLPDPVTHLTAVADHCLGHDTGVRKIKVSSSYLKSLTVRYGGFHPDAFVFPKLEHLRVLDGGRICNTFGHGQRHFPKLKRLECKDINVGDDLTALLEIGHTFESVVLGVGRGFNEDMQARYAWFRHLVLFVNLPPVVAFRVDLIDMLPDDVYFFQRLLARQSNSQVHILTWSLRFHAPELKEILAKYRTLPSTKSYYLYQDDYGDPITDTYVLTPDFVNAPLDNVDEKLKLLLAAPPNAS